MEAIDALMMPDKVLPLLQATLNMGVALLLGAFIGSEREMRHRMAGLRTNALVALGAAGYVTFAALFPDDINPTRVAAQVVSGIGFLGAGIIFRDGFNVHGLNTAATLWCSAAVGMMAGAGYLPYAAALTGLVVFINLALRFVVLLLNKFSFSTAPRDRMFQLHLRCARADEREMRAFLVRNLGVNNLLLHETQVTGDDHEVEITVHIHGEGPTERNIERSVTQMAMEPRITRTRWGAMEEFPS